jgi:c-di-GMP-binding flagellar brake protein YcgR
MVKTNKNSAEELFRLLQPGMKISVEIQFGPEDSYSFNTRLIGHKSDKYIALDFPKKNHDALVMRNIVNSTVIIRGMCGTDLGHIIAFKSSILQVIAQPFGMMFIRLPHHFATKPIRQYPRYKISLPVEINEGKKIYSGTLVDFSQSGCAVFIGGDNILKKHISVSINSALNQHISEPLSSEIANISRQSNGHLIGLRFQHPIVMNLELKSVLFEQNYAEE